MVTGQKAFQGKSYSSLLGSILSADPPPMSVKPFMPTWLERLVRRCLQKDPDDRYQSMRDVVIELQTPPQEVAAVVPSKASRWPWAIAASLAIVTGVALWAPWRTLPLPTAPSPASTSTSAPKPNATRAFPFSSPRTARASCTPPKPRADSSSS